MKRLIVFLLFIILFKGKIEAQNHKLIIIPDSLKNISFEKFEDIANNLNIEKSIKSKIANNFLLYSKSKNDQKLFVKSLYWKIRINLDANNVKNNIELLLKASNKIEDDEFPAKAHLLKSEYLMHIGLSKESLGEAIIAEKLAKEKNNYKQCLLIKKQLGQINFELNNLDSALQNFLDYKELFKDEKENSKEYLLTIFAISNIYLTKNQPEIALKINEESFNKITKNNHFYKYFLLNRGVAYCLKKEYKKSINILKEAIPLLKTKTSFNLPLAYHYYGISILKKDKDLKKANEMFLKADSIIESNKFYHFLYRNNFIELIEVFKQRKDKENQLKYLNKLIVFDSILSKKNGQLTNIISEKYEKPQLLEEKEKVINELKNEKLFNYLIIIIIVIGLSVIVKYNIKLRNDNKKFLLLIKQHNELKKDGLKIEVDVNVKDKQVSEIDKSKEFKSLEISEELVNEILEKLNKFEKNLAFLNPNIKQADLAKEFATNINYLSKVINFYKDKNFSQYLNDLRIDYVLTKIQEDKKFRSYTIKAISEECGFNTAESFSKAFNNKTGIQPSFFIKKIQGLNEN
ncbi:helix-turn-helix domain-containing protein [Flavobacterium davisii]|uniref:Helix-turn-helix domain-containing protein n=3 Tax=Flavobacterium TaxID=237 RepID=A0ABW8PLK5_9FLAO